MPSERLDTLLFEAGYFPSREKARAAVMAGLIRQGTKIIDKPGTKIKALPEDLVVQGNTCPYVSRGGLKLAAALQHFAIDARHQICLDIGASTGGFTDCLLQAGAEKVYAIDVGYGQIDWKLRNHPQVILLEKVNARYLSPADLYPDPQAKATLAVMDVSFISILKILPALHDLMPEEACLVSLIKPQFEAPPSDNRKGIVSDPKAHLRVLEMIQTQCPATGWFLHQVMPSPIRGKSGNREFLGVFYKKQPEQEAALNAALLESPHEPNTAI